MFVKLFHMSIILYVAVIDGHILICMSYLIITFGVLLGSCLFSAAKQVIPYAVLRQASFNSKTAKCSIFQVIYTGNIQIAFIQMSFMAYSLEYCGKLHNLA